jgi:methionine-S-sulfoxide reductase
MKSAYFAGGCFWCITPFFKMQDGVLEVTSGYSGGDEENPRYEDVKHQRTGHRETIKIDYDPEKISFEELVEMFLESVDPYDGEGQFIDKGFSYTLAIYYQDEAEKAVSEAKVGALAASSDKEVFVAIEPFKSFWRAEEYHQDYYLKNPEAFEKEMIESGRKKA